MVTVRLSADRLVTALDKGLTVAKPKIRLTLSGNTVSAPIWPKAEISWEGSKIGCPLCATIRKAKGILDVIQYGLIDHDLVVTIFECRACKKQFGVKYTIPHEHEHERESEE